MTWRAEGVAAGFALLAITTVTAAQTVDIERPHTLVVGTPPARARTDRIDAARSGSVTTPLPGGSALRTAWTSTLGAPLEVAPVVDAHGTTYAVSSRGDVVAIARDGTEKWRCATNATQPGPPALLSDETLVFADAVGEAIAVREGALQWRARFGRVDPSRGAPSAPLPLADGGVVVATTHDLAAFDRDGGERARTTLPEPLASSLLATLGKVVAVTASGTVWTWTPGTTDATRVTSFGSPVADGAALADEHTLLAITTERLRLVSVDLVRGSVATRASAGSGLFLGPPALSAGTAFLQLALATGELAVGFDADGREVARSLLATHPPAQSPDGGAAALVASPHTAPLVDAAGTMAFATADGSVGVVSKGVVVVLPSVCSPVQVGGIGGTGASAAPVTALTPLEPGAFVAACRTGTLTAVSGGAGGKPGPTRL